MGSTIPRAGHPGDPTRASSRRTRRCSSSRVMKRSTHPTKNEGQGAVNLPEWIEGAAAWPTLRTVIHGAFVLLLVTTARRMLVRQAPAFSGRFKFLFGGWVLLFAALLVYQSTSQLTGMLRPEAKSAGAGPHCAHYGRTTAAFLDAALAAAASPAGRVVGATRTVGAIPRGSRRWLNPSEDGSLGRSSPPTSPPPPAAFGSRLLSPGPW